MEKRQDKAKRRNTKGDRLGTEDTREGKGRGTPFSNVSLAGRLSGGGGKQPKEARGVWDAF